MARKVIAKSIRKILIANRGEIAVRVIRTCRDLGISTVAVYSVSDTDSPHARIADEAVLLTGETIAETYLNGNYLLDIAEECNVDAIHPGYGFLSENAGFAKACANRNIIFLGPEPHAINEMGDKIRARELMERAGVPVTPGVHISLTSDAEALHESGRIGYPVLVKAAAGGGGKGMRKAVNPADLPAAVKSARSESAAAFGDDRIYIEKYLEEPRHIEFQILADRHGNVVHLFERECSIQRRHQKVIEESPSSILDDKLRNEMGEAAVKAARSCGYIGAGTVEFLVDRHHRFYFLEMNTRLQVEHPVTEMVTGIDLVAWQIMIAEGKPLPWKQNEIACSGHAIECRICAENPMENFLPATGTIMEYLPPTGPGVRMDDGISAGLKITAEFDSILAKLVVHGNDRAEAISRMIRALDETTLTGCLTTLPFCRFVMDQQDFRAGHYDTHFISKHFQPEKLFPHTIPHPIAMIAGLLHIAEAKNSDVKAVAGKSTDGSRNSLMTGLSSKSNHNAGAGSGNAEQSSMWWKKRK